MTERRPTGWSPSGMTYPARKPYVSKRMHFAGEEPEEFEPTVDLTKRCWCGEVIPPGMGGHDWPGKSEGAPHPRQP
jgi:hypothetical protein